MLKILDTYILKKFLSTFFFAIMILALVSCVIDYSQKVDDFVSRKAPWGAIMFYYFNFIPSITALLFPLFVFIATIFFTSKMAYKTEIIATLASGISYQRFLRPFLIGGTLLGLLSLAANHYIVPIANKNINDFQYKYVWNEKISTKYNVHLRINAHQYAYVENFNYSTNSGSKLTLEKVNGTLLEEKIMAETAKYDTLKKVWTLQNVYIRFNKGVKDSLAFLPTLTKNLSFSPSDLDDDNRNKETMTTPQLIEHIAKEKLRGKETVNFYALELHRRSAQPFAAIVLTIIGACLASNKVRGGSGLHLALGIILSAIYMLFLQFTQTFSTNAGLDPLIAVWIPNVTFGLLALWLYLRQIK
jgi:lipopolysaccharide export system permease protein